MVPGFVYLMRYWEVANLDWNKTKTIFIIVFSILNVFLFSLYLNRSNESYEVVYDTPFEDRLLLENIDTSKAEAVNIQEAFYVSGFAHQFIPEELGELENQHLEIKSAFQLVGTFKEPVPFADQNQLESYIKQTLFLGESYQLWKIDEEEQKATFLQTVNNRTVFYNQNARIVVHWNENRELVGYEQTLLDKLEEYNESKKLLTPLKTIQPLYNRGLLRTNSKVLEFNLGYSTLVQEAETQVLAPTWHILIKLEDGTIEEYFVNAVEGKIIDIPKEVEQAPSK